MANPRYSNTSPSRGTDKNPAKQSHGSGDSSVPVKTADWPGLPGGAQSNRSLGVRKLKQGPAEKGI